jgi:hypothetical protein
MLEAEKAEAYGRCCVGKEKILGFGNVHTDR